jgi:hypothetical protein
MPGLSLPGCSSREKTGAFIYTWFLCFWRTCSGDIVLLHHRAGKEGPGDYQPSLFLRTPPEGKGEGHRDVVRCMWHDVRVSPIAPLQTAKGLPCGELSVRIVVFFTI